MKKICLSSSILVQFIQKMGKNMQVQSSCAALTNQILGISAGKCGSSILNLVQIHSSICLSIVHFIHFGAFVKNVCSTEILDLTWSHETITMEGVEGGEYTLKVNHG